METFLHLSSFWSFIRITLKVHISSMYLRTLPASTRYSVPKLFPHIWVFVIAVPHFLVPSKSVLAPSAIRKYHGLSDLNNRDLSQLWSLGCLR